MRGRDAEAYERVKRQLEIPMLVLSFAFIPVILVPVVGDPGPAQRSVLEGVGWFIWAAFVAEYVTLLYLAPDRRRMVRTHLLDLLIIVLPMLRPLRVLRLLRVGVAFGRGFVALRRLSTRPGFRGFLAVALLLIVAGAGLVMLLERNVQGSNVDGFDDALWWALVTSTTVGYGDHFPVTAPGRAVAVVLMLLGIALFSVLTANVAAFFVEADVRADAEDERERADGVSMADLDARLARIEELLATHPRLLADGDGRGVGELTPTADPGPPECVAPPHEGSGAPDGPARATEERPDR